MENQEDALEKMVSMLKKIQNDLQIILTDPYAHVYCEKS